MFIEGELYEPNKISNRQLTIYGNGWLTDIGKLALQHAHKAVPAVGRVFKFFYDRRKRKQAEAEKQKMKDHLMKMSADSKLKPEDRMKILDLLKEIKTDQHKYTNEQFHDMFDKVQKGVNLASMAGLYGIHKYEQKKEKDTPKETEPEQEFHDAETGGKMYLNPNKRRKQRQGKIPPKGQGFDEIIKLLKRNPEVAHKADKFNKKGLTLTINDIEYIKNLFKKHGIYNDSNKKSIYTIKNDFFSLTKPSSKQYDVLKDDKGNILNPNIYTKKKNVYNASVNGIRSNIDDKQLFSEDVIDRLNSLYISQDKLAKNLENIKDLTPENSVVKYPVPPTKNNKTSSESELMINIDKKHAIEDKNDDSDSYTSYDIEDLDEKEKKNIEKKIQKALETETNPTTNKNDLLKIDPKFKAFWDNYKGPKKSNENVKIAMDIYKNQSKNDTFKNDANNVLLGEDKDDINTVGTINRSNTKSRPEKNKIESIKKLLEEKGATPEENWEDYPFNKLRDYETKLKTGGKMYIRPSNRVKQRNGKIPPKGQGIETQKAVTLPFHFNDKKSHVDTHFPSMFAENRKGTGIFGGFLEAY